MPRPFDLIVFGATGFTGRLVAEYLNDRYGVGGAVTWAIAGRNRNKLVEVRNLIGAAAALPLLTADASDAASLDRLAAQAKVIITTVGPYQHMASRSWRRVRGAAPTMRISAGSRAGWRK